MSEHPSVLLVEDHTESRKGLTHALERSGHVVHQAATGKAALAIARRTQLHAAIVDLRLPDMDGLSVLASLLERQPGLPVIVVTGYASVDAAVQAMKHGATDFLTKPLRLDDLLRLLDRAIDRALSSGGVAPPASALAAEMERLGILGGSTLMREFFLRVKHLAPHYRTVLIQGESGTGKELVARALHTLGPGPGRPFIAVNCATLSETLIESELFGHEKGAFTSADTVKAGMMETADTGTLFLDEVNEMGLACQAKLLRALERREFRRLGGTRKIKVDLRVIGASNAKLDEWVAAKRFREDLFYRLKVVSVTVPPLRERQEAIPQLAQRFLDDVGRGAGLPPRRLTSAALQQLTRYAWPGNVRELKNVMESLALLTSGDAIDVDDLPANVRGASDVAIELPVGTSLREAERRIIARTLESYPTLRDAARVLGIGLRTLHTKTHLYGLRRSAETAPRRRRPPR
jgi:two-component system, NtrC family, response regulator AtoC